MFPMVLSKVKPGQLVKPEVQDCEGEPVKISGGQRREQVFSQRGLGAER